ncbi:hypothetical protein [uncultured Rhodospira sp.]|uniref:hypothetical protein n=1 Tax=uncultured Rhodospira sp. TaxID=1936189 RepID=UPI00263664D9|nr:hypothetical protein [uncultured Rhodospira sp.]
MSEVSGLSGATSSALQTDTVRPSAPADGNQRGGGAATAAASRAAIAADETQPAPRIRFEGQDLDPTAPRGTYLDIVV